jgi:methylated-DNA-protein-cysteine methyltransferase-like protein
MKTYQKIYEVVREIPKGKVATYGQIGQMLDLDPRVIGWALNRLAFYKKQRSKEAKKQLNIPWHRVINSKGGISTNKVMNIPLGLQKTLLENEGIRFDKGEKVDLKKYSTPLN